MKRIVLPLTVLLLTKLSSGQTPVSEDLLQGVTRADMGLQGIGLTRESRLSKSVTADFSIGAGGGYAVTRSSLDYQFLEPAMYVSAVPKFFYNIRSREKKGKSIRYNSGNYIGMLMKYSLPFSSKTAGKTFLTNIHWGMQRMISRRWAISAHAGPGYAYGFEKKGGLLYPAIAVRFSFVF